MSNAQVPPDCGPSNRNPQSVTSSPNPTRTAAADDPGSVPAGVGHGGDRPLVPISLARFAARQLSTEFEHNIQATQVDIQGSYARLQALRPREPPPPQPPPDRRVSNLQYLLNDPDDEGHIDNANSSAPPAQDLAPLTLSIRSAAPSNNPSQNSPFPASLSQLAVARENVQPRAPVPGTPDDSVPDAEVCRMQEIYAQEGEGIHHERQEVAEHHSPPAAGHALPRTRAPVVPDDYVHPDPKARKKQEIFRQKGEALRRKKEMKTGYLPLGKENQQAPSGATAATLAQPPAPEPTAQQEPKITVEAYDDYDHVIQMYTVNNPRKDWNTAEDWLLYFLCSTKNEHGHKRMGDRGHTSEGFIDGDTMHFIVVHLDTPRPTTVVGFTTRNNVNINTNSTPGPITWLTIYPAMQETLANFRRLAHPRISPVKTFSKRGMPSEQRFHRGYWLGANNLPLNAELVPEAIYEDDDDDDYTPSNDLV